MNNLKKIFKNKDKIIIGAIHFPPLLGYPGFPGFEIALKNALKDLKAFEKGGADAIIFENNYDIPHQIFVNPETIAAMTYLGEKIKSTTTLPIGISVLWNDYMTGLSIAKILSLQFIRIPVFVDKVKTSYGIIQGNPKEVIEYRKKIGADNILIFTDIHVKHAELLSKYSLVKSAELAIKNGSDGLIITGKWTGDAPDVKELEDLKKSVGEFPVIIGSGLDSTNAKKLMTIANAAIVSTSLKQGGRKSSQVNIKGYEQRISKRKVIELISSLK